MEKPSFMSKILLNTIGKTIKDINYTNGYEIEFTDGTTIKICGANGIYKVEPKQ